MNLIYVDDSGDESCSLWSALIVPEERWSGYLKNWLSWRKTLRHRDGVPIDYEIHSQEWLSKNPVPITGPGGADLEITKHDRTARQKRSQVFETCLKTIGSFTDARLITVHAPHPFKHPLYGECLARIEEFLAIERERGLVILDGEDQGYQYRAHHRALSLKTRRVLEDPTEMPSDRSQWIQMADICAHAAFQAVKQDPKYDKKFHQAYMARLSQLISPECEPGEHGILGA